MSEELRRCICGEAINIVKCSAHHTDTGVDTNGYMPCCKSCGLHGSWRQTKDEAVMAWNTRPIEDKLRQRLDDAELIIQGCANAMEQNSECMMDSVLDRVQDYFMDDE